MNLATIATSEWIREAEPIGWVFSTKVDGNAAKVRTVATRVGDDNFRLDYGNGRYTPAYWARRQSCPKR